jgi:lipid-A-disaccharide synthase
VKLYFVAGEHSGDHRGAELMRALQSRVSAPLEFHGFGGPEMQAVGGAHLVDWTAEAVVGLWDVLKKYGYFRAQFARILAEIEKLRPDALILIDYPGFNLRMAKAVRQRFPDIRIIYYISPQVWAWNRGRIPKMATYLDLMLCIFPFEKELYESSGLRTEFVGHPMLDSLAAKRTDIEREPALTALLPGSRGKEVRKIFPIMLETAKVLLKAQPHLRFAAAAASTEMRELMIRLRDDAGVAEDRCSIGLRNSHELMQRATVGLVASGTATLESAYFGMPTIVLYRVAWLTWVVGKRLVRVPFLGMPNILAGREVAREFLQEDARPDAIAEEVLRIAMSEETQRQVQADLAAVIAKLGNPGAGERAAAVIAAELALT